MAPNLMREGSRIFAMTSSGSTRVIKNYGARIRRQGGAGVAHPPASLRAGPPAVLPPTPSVPASPIPRRCARYPGIQPLFRAHSAEEPQRPRNDCRRRGEGNRRSERSRNCLDDGQRHRRGRRRRDHGVARCSVRKPGWPGAAAKTVLGRFTQFDSQASLRSSGC